jgi:hypothetical protein
MPTVDVTDEEINDVREVAGEIDGDFVSDLIDDLNDAEWDRALDLTTEWRKVTAGDLIALDGGRDGVKLSDQEGLDDIRRRMRLLLGLPEFRDASITGGAASMGVATEWRW